MAINTLITIKDAITAFADGHGQLQGRVIFEADDHRSAYITEENTYPLLFVAPIDVAVNRAMNVHTLRVYVYERINDDRLDVWENANDTSLILRDIRVWWNDYGVDDINIVEDPIGQFGCDKELDNLVGYYADIRFEIPSHGRCQVPVDVTPIPAPTCEDAVQVIEDSQGNELYSNSIPSGATETQVIQDSTAVLKDTLGATISTTPILAEGSEDIIAPNSTYLVEYVNGTDIQSGSIVSGGSVTVTVPNPIVCADTTIEVNGTIEGTVVSGSTIDVQLSDSVGVVIPTSVTVVGNDVQVLLPDAPTSPSDFRPNKSGAVTSYADYDGGYYQRGRDVSFYKLSSNNPYGNIWRFTGVGGGYYDHDTSQYKDINGTVTTLALAYPNSIMIDWNNRTSTAVMLWKFTTEASGTWDVVRVAALSLTIGGLSTWYLPETVEYDTLRNWGSATHFQWLPINTTAVMWTANTNPASTTVAWYVSGVQFAGAGKANSISYLPCRFTLLSEIGL